jgi:hypothetical protein
MSGTRKVGGVLVAVLAVGYVAGLFVYAVAVGLIRAFASLRRRPS